MTCARKVWRYRRRVARRMCQSVNGLLPDANTKFGADVSHCDSDCFWALAIGTAFHINSIYGTNDTTTYDVAVAAFKLPVVVSPQASTQHNSDNGGSSSSSTKQTRQQQQIIDQCASIDSGEQPGANCKEVSESENTTSSKHSDNGEVAVSSGGEGDKPEPLSGQLANGEGVGGSSANSTGDSMIYSTIRSSEEHVNTPSVITSSSKQLQELKYESLGHGLNSSPPRYSTLQSVISPGLVHQQVPYFGYPGQESTAFNSWPYDLSYKAADLGRHHHDHHSESDERSLSHHNHQHQRDTGYHDSHHSHNPHIPQQHHHSNLSLNLNPISSESSAMRSSLLALCPTYPGGLAQHVGDDLHHQAGGHPHQHSSAIDEVIADTLKDENCSIVDHYLGLGGSATPNGTMVGHHADLSEDSPQHHHHHHDLHDLKDYGAGLYHNNNDKSSRSPSGYSHEELETGLTNFTQLINVPRGSDTGSQTVSSMYQSSSPVHDHGTTALMQHGTSIYDALHAGAIPSRSISPQPSQTANLQLLVSQNLTSAAQWDNLRRGQLSQMQQRTFAPKQAKSHVRVRGQSRVRVVSHSWASTSRPSGVVWVSSVSSVGFGRVGLVCGKTAHFSWRKEEIGGLCWNQEQFK
ncbi:transcription factor GATA-4 [Culex quinquefasciatus]|uniref:Transcription factor GATA-4 n=1 Tax=Culex quinquefasciatus TaxID=7176 RepID=B0WLN1_CULQU|nr:transcription factor GATA-4 [Culex quinquefasciatus]|eukprot:XP_001849615.1 transcription factor GATA-4 [Culex quinquefasciatus]